jgi:hypothetical protein
MKTHPYKLCFHRYCNRNRFQRFFFGCHGASNEINGLLV